jgi:hypothetical protein
MKIGDKVAVLWDGKLGRGVLGTVTGTRKNGRIRVEFPEWLEPETVHHIWFPKRQRRVRRGGPRYEHSRFIIDDKGYHESWYMLFPLKKHQAMGYTISTDSPSKQVVNQLHSQIAMQYMAEESVQA